MIILEDKCVSCGLPCVGHSCDYYVAREVCYCDCCCEEVAIKNIDGKNMCKECAEQYLDNAFHDLSIEEKAEALDIDCTEVEVLE